MSIDEDVIVKRIREIIPDAISITGSVEAKYMVIQVGDISINTKQMKKIQGLGWVLYSINNHETGFSMVFKMIDIVRGPVDIHILGVKGIPPDKAIMLGPGAFEQKPDGTWIINAKKVIILKDIIKSSLNLPPKRGEDLFKQFKRQLELEKTVFPDLYRQIIKDEPSMKEMAVKTQLIIGMVGKWAEGDLDELPSNLGEMRSQLEVIQEILLKYSGEEDEMKDQIEGEISLLCSRYGGAECCLADCKSEIGYEDCVIRMILNGIKGVARPQCPNCDTFTDQRELDENQGVCALCLVGGDLRE